MAEQSVNNMKEDLNQRVNINMERNYTILELKILSQNEQLENYNRRVKFARRVVKVEMLINK